MFYCRLCYIVKRPRTSLQSRAIQIHIVIVIVIVIDITCCSHDTAVEVSATELKLLNSYRQCNDKRCSPVLIYYTVFQKSSLLWFQ